MIKAVKIWKNNKMVNVPEKYVKAVQAQQRVIRNGYYVSVPMGTKELGYYYDSY